MLTTLVSNYLYFHGRFETKPDGEKARWLILAAIECGLELAALSIIF